MSNEKKQTAVDYLLLTLYGLGFIEDIDDVFVQQIKNEALQMERKQIIEAHENGVYDRNDYLECAVDYQRTAEQYYKETYGK